MKICSALLMAAVAFAGEPPPPGLAQASAGKLAELKLTPAAKPEPPAADPNLPRPTRIGEHRRIDAALWKKRGSWFKTKSGTAVWRVAVRSAGAAALRVHFREFNVGAGQVWVHNGKDFTGPFTGTGLYPDGDFWAAVIGGDRIVVEYQPAEGAKATGTPPLSVPEVSHLTVNPLL